VRIAYRSGRDTTLLTTKRLLAVDVRGLTGTEVCYTTIAWERVRLFSTETPPWGAVFSGAEMDIYTDIPALARWHQDLSKNVNLEALQKFLVDVTCGVTTGDPPPISEQADAEDLGGEDKMYILPSWLAGDGNAAQIDATKADQLFRFGGPGGGKVLQSSEIVEMAFKGRKDYVLFTSKRIIFVDNCRAGLLSGFSSKQIYVCVPYGSISHFAVQTAGGWLDFSAELQVWTDAAYEREITASGEKMSVAAKRGYCYFEQDLDKKRTDLNSVHRYISEKVLMVGGLRGKTTEGPPKPTTVKMVAPAGEASADPLAFFTKWCTDNAVAINPDVVDKQMHDNGMLQDDESTMLAFANGRDLLLLTTKRVFRLDTKGWTGNRCQYLSIPYSSMRSFSVSSAAARFDSDGELMIDLNCNWPLKNPMGSDEILMQINPRDPAATEAQLQKIRCCLEQDLSAGSCDTVKISNLMADRLIANNGSIAGGPVPDVPGSKDGASGNKLMQWLEGRDYGQLDAAAMAEIDNMFHTAPNILTEKEPVEVGFTGRKGGFFAKLMGLDTKLFVLYTPSRILVIQKKKSIISGEKWFYKTIPWKQCNGIYAVKRQNDGFCAGYFDRDKFFQLNLMNPQENSVEVTVEADQCDLFGVSRYVEKKLALMDEDTFKQKVANADNRLSDEKAVAEAQAAAPAAPEAVVLVEQPVAEAAPAS